LRGTHSHRQRMGAACLGSAVGWFSELAYTGKKTTSLDQINSLLSETNGEATPAAASPFLFCPIRLPPHRSPQPRWCDTRFLLSRNSAAQLLTCICIFTEFQRSPRPDRRSLKNRQFENPADAFFQSDCRVALNVPALCNGGASSQACT